MTSAAPDPALEALLEFLKRTRGFDLTGYKRSSLERRLQRRMAAVGAGSYGDYLDHLEVHPDEYEALFDALLINVTEFFRDPPAWDHLRAEVLPELLAAKPENEPVRVWSAGSSSGQEAYTLAMVLAEELGLDAYRERVKIYATDVDEDALATARLGSYTHKQLEAVPAELRTRYFERAEQKLAFRKDLRRTVIFGHNNLVADAPISRLDLLVCRNTLMYFTAETQERVLRHFHFALADHGTLMLGRSEMLLAHRDLFTSGDVKARVFRKRPRPQSLQTRVAGVTGGQDERVPLSEDERLSREAALDLAPVAQMIVSRSGLLTFANLSARTLFGIGTQDLGRAFNDVAVASRPVDLRPAVEEALRERRRVALGEVGYVPDKGEERRLEVSAVPLLENGVPAHGVAMVFEDVTRYAAAQRQLESHRRDLELAYEELQSTIDELETTNEELQSANEELQTTNEELQSTNEELETMNEELQSANEELETMNHQLRDRTRELDRVNRFLETVLTSLGVGVAVLDPRQRVLVWSTRAEELWGLRGDEAVDHDLSSLDIGLPVDRLAAPLQAVIEGGSDREQLALDAVNRRGRRIACATTLLPLRAAGADGEAPEGVIVLMEDGPPAGA